MPFTAAPTPPPNISQKQERRPRQPTPTVAASKPAISPFVLGSDTCGFASTSTLTCDHGYECVNVGNYRGCCETGSQDCASDVHMACLDYENMPDASLCGPHLLCCPSTKAYCVSYGFVTADQPSMTFTHFRCAETPVLAELHPYPPALMTIVGEPITAGVSSISTAESAPSTTPSPSTSLSPGAIAGAVVGSVVGALLIALGIAFMIIRKRRRRKERAENDAEPEITENPSDEDVEVFQRPLSTVQEEPNPYPSEETPDTSDTHRHSGSTPRRSSGPSRSSSRRSSSRRSSLSPLSLHPVADWDRRSSGPHDATTSPQYTAWPRVGPQPTPSPKSAKRPETRRNSSGSSLSSTKSRAFLSPRVASIPPPAIDEAINAALNEEGSRRASISRPPSITFNNIGFPVPPSHPASTPSLEEVLRSADAGNRSRRSSQHSGHPSAAPRSDARFASHHMSWLDDEDDVLGTRRLSTVSAGPVRRGSRARGESFGDAVSPLSPPGGGEGRVTPMTVSPLGSRRQSYDEVRRD
ncbi:hypothetical protein F4861DRAFT_542604 [Xylaria intraflava]|nr:hypothetical protein F4861DRAFT_542604 [Xylaria intraflava]